MHSPEHVCEALEWLYGGEWHSHGHGNYSGGNLCVSESNGGKWCVERYVGRRDDVLDCTDRVAHALAVIAPWAWVYDRADMPIGNGYAVLTYVAEHAIWFWYVKDPAGTDFEGPDIEGHGKTEDEAKALARTAYLTYMRGRLALRGLEK